MLNRISDTSQRRVHISSAFDGLINEKNLAISISNDVVGLDSVGVLDDTLLEISPMLVYGSFLDSDGVIRDKFTTPYHIDDWNVMFEKSNKDGDAMVFLADIYPFDGGWRVDVDSITATDIPFCKKSHRANTLRARQVDVKVHVPMEYAYE